MENKISKEIEDFLKSEEWTLEEDIFSKTIQKASGMVAIINGQQVQQPPVQVTFKIKFQGIGAIDDTPIYGYSLYIVGEENDNTIYVYDLEDFKKEIYANVK